MNASIERLSKRVGLIRVHPAGYGDFGDPFTWSVVFVKRGDVAVLKGVYRKPTHEESRAVRAALRRAGFTGYIRDKLQGGILHRRIYPL